MKGHRKTRGTGGVTDADMAPKMVYAGADSNVRKEATAKKRGGKAMGKMAGEESCERSDRKARKSGGKTGGSPFSAAHAGTAPKGRNLEMN